MALSKVWVHAELTPEGNVAPISLEILAKAREIADVVEVFTGSDGAAASTAAGAHGATKVLATGDISDKLQGVHVGAALAAAIEAGDAAAARDALQRDIGTTAAYIEARQVLAPD